VEATNNIPPIAAACAVTIGAQLARGKKRAANAMRYAHTNIDSKRAAVEKLDGFGDNLMTVHPKMHQSRAVLSLNRAASYNV